MANKHNSALENLMDNNLAGLIIPETEPATPLLIEFLVFFGLMMAVLGLYQYLQFRRRKTQIALRKIKRLESQKKQYTAQGVVNKLANILREGLNVTRLSLFTPSSYELEQWQRYKQKLDAACYSNKPLSQDELMLLIKQTRQWLKQQ